MTSIQIPSIEFSDNRIKKCSVVIDKNSFNVEYKKGKYVVTKGGVTSSKTETSPSAAVEKTQVVAKEAPVVPKETPKEAKEAPVVPKETPKEAKAETKTPKLAKSPARSTPLNPDQLKLNLKNAFTPGLMDEMRNRSKMFNEAKKKEGNQG